MHQPSQKPGTPRDHVGLRCRRCGHDELRVVYTRRRPGGTVDRRRECKRCGTRITTREREVGG
jgi:transcriptional regulator NrdR family protein